MFVTLVLTVIFTSAGWSAAHSDAGLSQPGVNGIRCSFAADDPLSELRDKHRVYLSAGYTYEVDARSFGDARHYARAILAEVADQRAVARRRHERAYRTIRDRLKKYGRKHKSLILVERPEEADFVIVFYVTGKLSPVTMDNYRDGGVLPFTPFPTGELLVLRKATTEDPEPKIVAHTRRGGWAKDVIDAFIKELKAVRGER